jgi:hypothetical protein
VIRPISVRANHSVGEHEPLLALGLGLSDDHHLLAGPVRVLAAGPAEAVLGLGHERPRPLALAERRADLDGGDVPRDPELSPERFDLLEGDGLIVLADPTAIPYALDRLVPELKTALA